MPDPHGDRQPRHRHGAFDPAPEQDSDKQDLEEFKEPGRPHRPPDYIVIALVIGTLALLLLLAAGLLFAPE